MKRINWIDWVKVLAITMVVFGHVPEQPNNFLLRYICTFHMPLFFFISGYLTKVRTNIKESLYKYWHTLIIPYFLYNMIFYPYWLIRHVIENGNFSVFDIFIRPTMGILTGQMDTSFSCIVSGVTWFLIALFVMRLLVDTCNNFKYNILLMIVISIICIILNITIEYYDIVRQLLFRGLFRCLPFYVLGHLLQRYRLLESDNFYHQIKYTLIYLIVSLSFYFLLDHSEAFWISTIRAYGVALTATLSITYACMILNKFTSQFLVTLSTGTIVIMGLHWMFIGTINYIVQKLCELDAEVKYDWLTSIMLSIFIVLLIYPIILFAKKHFPAFLGKNNPEFP